MYKRNLDIMVEPNTRVCNGSKCKGKEVPLNQNNFLIVNGNYEDVCKRCSEYRRCDICMEALYLSSDNFHRTSSGYNCTCKKCRNMTRRKYGKLYELIFSKKCTICNIMKRNSEFTFINMLFM